MAMAKMATQNVTLSFTSADVRNSVKSQVLSRTFVEKLVRAAVLNIMYRRVNIDGSNFEMMKPYENIPIARFTRKSNNTFIRAYHSVVKAIIDALRKNYLKRVYMYIKAKHTNELIETYIFSLKYNKNENATDPKDSKLVKQTVVEFFTAILSLEQNKKFDEDEININYEFAYYDETPPDYEPPGFEPSPNATAFELSTSNTASLGTVNTGYHKVKCLGQGEIFAQQSRPPTPANVSAHIVEDENDVDDLTQIDKENVEPETEESIDPKPKRRKKQIADITISIDASSDSNALAEDECTVDNSNLCFCKLNLPQYDSVKCTKCSRQFHIICGGYENKSKVDVDASLCSGCQPDFDKSKLLECSHMRIILHAMNEQGKLPVDTLALLPFRDRRAVLTELSHLGVYKDTKSGINKQRLQLIYSVLFQNANSEVLN